MKKHNESVKLFENPILEKLTHVHPITPICIFTVMILYFSHAALMHHSIGSFICRFLGGIFLWTFIEYTIHRFFYHFEVRGPKTKKFVFLIHGIHHYTPRDTTRLVSPPVISISASVLILVIYHWIFGVNYEAPFAGTIFGYLIYDLIHFSVHHFNWKNAIFKYLKHYHFTHHYRDSSKAFGVSSPFWDLLFQTRPSQIGSDKIL